MKPEDSFALSTPCCSERDLTQLLAGLGLFTPTVQAALDLAKLVHENQKRDDGSPYLDEHVYPIAEAVAKYFKERSVVSGNLPHAEIAVATALLHDVLEDSRTMSREDIERQVGPVAAEAVAFLTKPSYEDLGNVSRIERERVYFDNLAFAPDWVKTIKLFDRINNLQCLHKSGPLKRRHYLTETLQFHLPMAKEIDQGLATRIQSLVSRLQTIESH